MNQRMAANNTLSGDFTVFGFTHNPRYVMDCLAPQLKVIPHTFQIGDMGQFFYYTTYGEVAESEDVLLLKFGFLRNATKTPLTARELLDQKLALPREIQYDRFSGNGMVVAISKTEPVFSAFQTMMSVPQLFYSETPDGFFCSDLLRCIIQVLPRCELNEKILPQHFLFRSVYGSDTYFSGVNRLIPGQSLVWNKGHLELSIARKLDVIFEEAKYIRDDARALDLLHETLEDVVEDYIRQTVSCGCDFASLLSGGVDSSMIQYYMNSVRPGYRTRSISFAIQVPTFEFEVEYARQASKLFDTDHTFVNYTPDEYPGLLSRVIDTLAQPPNLETEPSFLSVAEYIHNAKWPERFFFTGQGGDTLFGGKDALKLKGVNYIRRIPGAVPLMRVMGKALAPVTHKSHMFFKAADIIENENNVDAFVNPSNSVCVYVLEENWDILHRCFGERILRETFAARRNQVGQFTKSQHYLDKVYFIDLLTDLWELGVERNSIFLASRLEQVSPFFDEDMVKMALAIHPDLRYIKGIRYKHLLRRLLQQRTNAPVAHKRKGPSNVNDDLVAWMRTGSLRPLVENIERPAFMEKKDFGRMINKPDYFMWPLLTLDIFQKRLLGHSS